MQIKPIEELSSLARGHASTHLPIETHTSFPIPVRGGKVLFLYCPSAVKPNGLFLFAPDHVGRLDAETGALDALDAVTPAELGQAHARHELLGKYNMRRAVTSPKEYLDLQRRLYDDYDLLLPHFYAGASSLPPAAGRAAAEFVSIFSRVNEEVLAPYYARAGDDFFGWLGRTARL
jgi:hypothetical protein